MKFGQAMGAILISTVFLGSLSACEKHEGPVEQAGKSVDEAMDKAGEKMEQAGDAVQDAAKGEKQ